jgi:hypothetical protein
MPDQPEEEHPQPERAAHRDRKRRRRQPAHGGGLKRIAGLVAERADKSSDRKGTP